MHRQSTGSAPVGPEAVILTKLAPNDRPGTSLTQNPSSTQLQQYATRLAFIKCYHMPGTPSTFWHLVLTVGLQASAHLSDRNEAQREQETCLRSQS